MMVRIPQTSVRLCLAAAIFSLGILGSPSLAHAAGGWQAGVAKVVITPREPIWLAGYGNRDRPTAKVLQDIYAKALALRDESGVTSVLVTADLLGFSREMGDTVAARAAEKYGLPRERLVFNASHTHSAPVTGDVLSPAYPMEQQHREVVKRYTERLLDQIVDLIGASIDDLAPAEVSFGQGLAGFAVNRRRARQGKRHLPAPVDHDVPVLAVKSADGALKSVVFGYACHATVLSGYEVSGDWPGFAQHAIEQRHPGAVALFVTGCGADLNPLPRRSVDLARGYGETLATAVDLVLDSSTKPLRGPLGAAFERVELPFYQPPNRKELESRLKTETGARRRHAEYLLDVLRRTGKVPASYPYPIQVWQFGPDLTFLHLAGEVVVDYSLRFKRTYGWDDTWVAGYSNDVFAYIPSLRVLNEGGYEGGGAMIYYGQPSRFGAAVEEIIAEKVDELIRQAGGGR